jgi:hypothetical protein
MLSNPLTLDAWRARLERQGHRIIKPKGKTATGFHLFPDKDTVIWVAVEKDEAMLKEWRQRFFLCEPDPEQVLRVLGCPEPHRGRWLQLVTSQPPGYWRDFLAGPGSWLLSRLTCFREVVAWSDRGLPWDALDDPCHRIWGMEVPTEAARFFAPSRPDSQLPRRLPVGDVHFADAVAACVLFASVGSHDCYLADGDGAEVYLAHHHDQVIVSIPAVEAREALLRELARAPSVIHDVSGFGASLDENEDVGNDL